MEIMTLREAFSLRVNTVTYPSFHSSPHHSFRNGSEGRGAKGEQHPNHEGFSGNSHALFRGHGQ